MRKILISRSYLLMLLFVLPFVLGATSNHLEGLKSKFPYGLLGDDYGVLTLDDLAINSCDARPMQFDPASPHHSYQYWQCLESKNISFSCDSNGVPDDHEGVMGLVVAKASINYIQHEYIERRFWPIKDCKNFLKDVATLLKGIRYACISGSFIGNETDHLGHQSTSWIFERIKTKKGCAGHDCEFTKKFKKDNCPNMKL